MIKRLHSEFQISKSVKRIQIEMCSAELSEKCKEKDLTEINFERKNAEEWFSIFDKDVIRDPDLGSGSVVTLPTWNYK